MDISLLLTYDDAESNTRIQNKLSSRHDHIRCPDPPQSPATTIGSEDVGAQIERLTPISVDESMYDNNKEIYQIDDAKSLKSTIYEYRMENGRTYHRYRDGVYLLPNDEPEKERLDIVHNMYYVFLGKKLHFAPITNPRRILDLGCGTGIWSINMAYEHPNAEIYGIDLSPIQPPNHPPNFHPQIDDIEDTWTFPPSHFDFIFSRHLGQSILNWEKYLSQLYHHCTPGGWVELSEHIHDLRSDDNTFHDGLGLFRYMDLLKTALRLAGRDPDVALKLGRMLRKVGFKDVKVTMLKLPWGKWPSEKKLKVLGQWSLLALGNDAFEGFAMALFTRALGMGVEEARRVCREAERDVWDPNVHVYLLHFIVTARKPREGER